MSSETWKLEKDLCRCCHAEGSFTSLTKPSHDLPQAETFSEMLRRCFDIDIHSMEGTYNTSTYTICELCILQLRDASNFKQQVLRCEERFKDMYRNLREIKEEYCEISDDEVLAADDRNDELKKEYFEMIDDDAVAADDGHDELKEECFEMSDYDTVAADDQNDALGDITVEKEEEHAAHYDAPLPKQPRLETNDDETDQVKPQKEMKGPEDIASNVDLNKNTSTDIERREVNGQTNKSYNLTQSNQTLQILQNVFRCNDCGKRFDNERTFAVHIGSHEKLKQGNDLKGKECSKNVCSVCGHNFKLRSSLKRHLRIHTGEKPHCCSFCEYKCIEKSSLTKHLRIHTGEKPYSCCTCDYKGTEKALLTRHMRTHTGEKPYSCSVCEYKSAHKRLLTKHLRIHTGVKPYSCSIVNNINIKECAYHTETRDALERHSKLDDKNSCFVCDICGYTVKMKYRLLNHFKLNHVHSRTPQASNISEYGTNEIKKHEQGLCFVCGYKCEKRYLKRHLRIHNSEKMYSCSLCEYKSTQKFYLKTHLLIHTGDKPHSCSFCEYKCKHKRALTKHLRIHTGEKPYSCSFCDYKSLEKACLTRHVRIHTGEKPYSCSSCDYKCTRKQHLTKHLLKHSR